MTTAKATPAVPAARVQRPVSPKPAPLQSPDDRKARRAKEAIEALETIGLAAGVAATLTGNQTLQLDAMALGIHAESTGMGAAEFAERNTFVTMLLDRASAVTGAFGLLAGAMPLLYQVVANHAPKTKKDPATGEIVPNELPPQLMAMGVLPPEMLFKKYQANVALKVARMQERMASEIRQAEDEVQRLTESALNGVGNNSGTL